MSLPRPTWRKAVITVILGPVSLAVIMAAKEGGAL
jgi:hypothetical protein